MNTEFLIKSIEKPTILLEKTIPNKKVESVALALDKNKFSAFNKIAKFVWDRIKIESRTKPKWHAEVTQEITLFVHYFSIGGKNRKC